jgi:hypothetical protein
MLQMTSIAPARTSHPRRFCLFNGEETKLTFLEGMYTLLEKPDGKLHSF